MNDDPADVDVLYGKMELQDGSDRSEMSCFRFCDNFTPPPQDWGGYKFDLSTSNPKEVHFNVFRLIGASASESGH